MHEWTPDTNMSGVSISESDLAAGSPKEGDHIAENPNDPSDKWLVSKEFLAANYKEVPAKGATGVSFGHAEEALKQGKRVARAGWNGKGMFVFRQVPSFIDGSIVDKMQSLPDSVKAEFNRRFAKDPANAQIQYKNQLAMVYPDNTIYGWVASPSDVLEEDWCILD